MDETNVSKNTGYCCGICGKEGLRGPLSLVAIILSLFLLVMTIKELKEYGQVGAGVPAVNTINVSGQGEAFAEPDIATFSFTVMDEAKVVKTAQDSVTKTTGDILAYLKKQKVEDKDIRTTSYDIYPRYDYMNAVCQTTTTSGAENGVMVPSTVQYCPPGKQILAGYDVSETIEVKVRKIADAGTIISGLGGLGATNVSGLSFTVENEEQVTAEARTKAINDAKNKAQELAKELGVRLVRVVNFSESGNYPVPLYYAKGMGVGGAVNESASASVPTGQNKFQSNVSITYEIR